MINIINKFKKTVNCLDDLDIETIRNVSDEKSLKDLNDEYEEYYNKVMLEIKEASEKGCYKIEFRVQDSIRKGLTKALKNKGFKVKFNRSINAKCTEILIKW